MKKWREAVATNYESLTDSFVLQRKVLIEQIVRCKDCCHNEGSLSDPWCRIYECRKSNNGFCDEGKRRE